jgi:hypothetical protein
MTLEWAGKLVCALSNGRQSFHRVHIISFHPLTPGRATHPSVCQVTPEGSSLVGRLYGGRNCS